MKTKPKLIICSIIFFVGGFVNIFFSTSVHQILSKQTSILRLMPIAECIGSIFSSKQHLMLFACLQGFILVLAIMYFLTNLRPYQSHLHTVTPDIQTPSAVGQYQHGSAKWLTDKEKDKAFESFVLDPDDRQIAELLLSGYAGLDFLKQAKE